MMLRIYNFFFMAVVCVGILFFAVYLATFKYSNEQMDTAINKSLSLKTGQPMKELSKKTLSVTEKHDVRVVLFQYEGTDGVMNGTAVFSKLPLISRYRFDRLFIEDNSEQAATVIDTGLTEELVVVNGSQIAISTADLGTVSNGLIAFVLISLFYFLAVILRTLDRKEKRSLAKDAETINE